MSPVKTVHRRRHLSLSSRLCLARSQAGLAGLRITLRLAARSQAGLGCVPCSVNFRHLFYGGGRFPPQKNLQFSNCVGRGNGAPASKGWEEVKTRGPTSEKDGKGMPPE